MLLFGLTKHQNVIDIGDSARTVHWSLLDAPLEHGAQVLETQQHLDVLARTQWHHGECQRSTVGMQRDVVISIH